MKALKLLGKAITTKTGYYTTVEVERTGINIYRAKAVVVIDDDTQHSITTRTIDDIGSVTSLFDTIKQSIINLI